MPDASTITDPLQAQFLGTLGLALVGYAKGRFEPGENDWKKTAWPRVAELLEDLQDGIVKDRTLQKAHQTGVGTGQLRDSIHSMTTDDGIGIVIGGAHIDYAERFHSGGTNTLPVPQRELRRWYRTKKGKAFIKEHQLGWLFGMQEVSFTSVARPIVEKDGVRRTVLEEARDFFGADAEVLT